MSNAQPRSHPFAIEQLELRRLLTATALDLNFGVQGRVVSDFRVDGQEGYDYLSDAILQSDGKLVAAVSGQNANGSFNPFLVRYSTDGRRDESFGPGGLVALPKQDDTIYKRIHVLPDGKLLLAGQTSAVLSGVGYTRVLFARLNADFSLDDSFGVGGVATSEFTITNSVGFLSALLPDGKILVGGQVNEIGHDYAAIWRFNSDGNIDDSFGNGGLVRFDDLSAALRINDLLVNPDGSFFAGMPIGTRKFTADGTNDMTFGDQGHLPQDLLLQCALPDGKLLGIQPLLLSYRNTDTIVSRWNADGTPDASFGVNGQTQIDFDEVESPSRLILDASGRIVVAAHAAPWGTGSNGGFALARLLSDGTPDPAFGSGGKVLDYFGSQPNVLLQTSDGRIIVAGTGSDLSTENPSLPNQGQNVVITRYVPDAPIDFSIASSTSVNEGDLFSISANGSSYANGQIIRHEWDNGFDGWKFASEVEGPSVSFRAGDSPSTQVALRVTTSDGLQAQLLITIPINNVPPVANAGTDRTVLVSWTDEYSFRMDDVVPEAGTLIVEFGDGSPKATYRFTTPATTQTVTVFHRYDRSGTYTLMLTANDGDGGVSTDTAIIRSSDVWVNVFQDPAGLGAPAAHVPFPGALVWVDYNSNGMVDANEPTSTTDANGDAYLGGVAAGTRKVRVQSPGWQISTPADMLNAGYCSVQTGGGYSGTCSFGLTQKSMITGTVFNDLNGNGIRDAGEGGVSGVRFQRDSYTSVLSGTDGFYRVRGLSAGAFQMYMTPPTGWIQTFPFGLAEHIATTALGQTVDHVDYGLRHIAGATARGIVFIDSNGDGLYGPGESPYTPQDWWYQFPIWLDANNDGVWDQNEKRVSVSVTSGFWTIPDLPAGTYTFRLLPRPLFVPTLPAENAGINVTLGDGQTSPFLYFGLQKLDTQPPQLSNITFRYDLKPNEIEMFFSEPLEATTSPLRVMLNGKEVAWDGFWWDYGVYDKIRLIPRGGLVADGNYQVSLIPHVLFDKADNELPPMPNWSFFALKGDLDRDRQVTIADFIILASNFGKTNATYADGDTNYDGQVTIADFLDLAANFNASLPPPAPAAPAEAAAAAEVSLTASAPLAETMIGTTQTKVIKAKAALLFLRPAKHHRKPRHQRN